MSTSMRIGPIVLESVVISLPSVVSIERVMASLGTLCLPWRIALPFVRSEKDSWGCERRLAGTHVDREASPSSICWLSGEVRMVAPRIVEVRS